MATSSILKMFATSPLKPLQKHMHKAVHAVGMVPDFFLAVIEGDWVKAEEVQQAICHAEQEADELKREIRMRLPRGLFMSMPRSDILALLKVQDTLANAAKDVAGLTLGRRLVIPEAISGEFILFVRRSIDAVNQCHRAVEGVDELMETGFRGSGVNKIKKLINGVDDIETETDDMQIDLRRQLFAIEANLAPIDAMFLYKIIEKVGELADRAQEVGERLVLLIAK